MNPTIKEYFLMAIKNIKNRKLRSWLTMIGIFIGILSIVALIGLGEGLRIAIIGQFGVFAPDVISVTTGGSGGPPGTGDIIPFTDDDLKKINSLREVDSVAGRTISFGKAEFNDEITFISSVSMPDGDARKLVEYVTAFEIDKGRLLRDNEKGKIVIGANLAEKTRFGKEIKTGTKIKVNDVDFEVIGVLKKKGSFQIDGTIFMNDDDFNNIFNRNKGEYSLIGVRYKDSIYTSEEAVQSIEKLLRKQRDVKEGEENFRISTPQNTINNLNDTLFAVQLFVYIIAGISIVVGGIGIMTTMYTTVVERTKEIGIMKAIGAKNNTIFSLFFIESGFIGLTGGLIGALFGTLIAKGLAIIGKNFLGSDLIQANISLELIIGSLILSFLLGSIFGTLPAIRASKMHPVEALENIK